MRRAVSLAMVFSAALLLPAAPAAALTEVFNYTGAEDQFMVPTGVHTVKVIAIGGTGGAATTASGGEAAYLSSGLLVTPGQTLYIEVGGKGQNLAEGGAGGFNGGASGAGGGGGASDIRTTPRASGLSPDTRLLVAAGGGGAGGDGPLETGGAGGNAGAPGGTAGYEGGGAGTETEGGAGSNGCNVGGESGHLGLGGPGGDSGEESDPGGGGGGGLYGGGGGGGACLIGSGGGGGGSSLTGVGLLSLTTAAPKIEITYSPPPSVTITDPVDDAVYPQGKSINSSYSCLAGEGTTVKSCAGPVSNGSPIDTSTPGEHTFTVEAEDNDKGTASKSVSYTVVSNVQAPAAVIPNTTLGSHPKKKVKTKKKAKVKFTFSSDAVGATFECKLDKGAFALCTSPKTYRVKPGNHTFSVEAVGPGGTDASPATYSFKVKKKK